MSQKDRRFAYGGRMASVRPAAGLTGVLCGSIDGDYFLRVKTGKRRFKDYELIHSDLTVTIGRNEEAALYQVGREAFLDHSPETLGLVEKP